MVQYALIGMNLSKIALPTSIVPNLIPAHRPVTQDIVDHLRYRINHDQGFVVFDTTGLLSRIVCHHLPKPKIKEVFICDSDYQFPTNMAANFLTPYAGETGESLAVSAVELFETLYGKNITPTEAELLELSVEVLHDVFSIMGTEWSQILSPLSLAAFLIDHEFRELVCRHTQDVRLKMALKQPIDEYAAYRLTKKMKFLFEDPQFMYGINRCPNPDHPSDEFDIEKVHQKGKIALINLRPSKIGLSLYKYIVATFYSRFERSASSNFDIDSAYFFSGTYLNEHPFFEEKPAFSKHMYPILKRFCGMRYGRKPCFLESEQAAFFPKMCFEKLDPILGIRSQFDPAKYDIYSD